MKHHNSVLAGLLTIAGIYAISHQWIPALRSVIWIHTHYNNATTTQVPLPKQ